MIGVTVLTSIDDLSLSAVASVDLLPTRSFAWRFARHAGLDGVVCSAHDIAGIRKACGPDFLLAVPGIQPAGAELADQRRVMTPAQAYGAGADILVIGRRSRRPDLPRARAIAAELSEQWFKYAGRACLI